MNKWVSSHVLVPPHKHVLTPFAYARAHIHTQVWEEYKVGGACRWLWLLCYLLPRMPPYLSQYFVDQVAAFLHDHFPGEQGA